MESKDRVNANSVTLNVDVLVMPSAQGYSTTCGDLIVSVLITHESNTYMFPVEYPISCPLGRKCPNGGGHMLTMITPEEWDTAND